MESDDGDARTDFEARRQNAQTFRERAELIIHFHTQCLKRLRRWMPATVPTHRFFDRAGK